MKTDELITMLASDAGPVVPRAWRGRYAAALGVGLAGAVALMLPLLGLRPDLAEAAALPMFWVKLAFPLMLAIAALAAAARLSRPGMALGLTPAALAAPVIVIWVLALVALAGAAPEERSALLMGATWQSCPAYVTLLSLPAFICTLWVMKTLAPTRPALAGAVSGLLAGGVGATVYALHCPEMEAPFLAVWYLLGMLIPTVLGAVIGSRLLRW
ncbi:MAG: NrsF family protein [Burkholderiales bacterium]